MNVPRLDDLMQTTGDFQDPQRTHDAAANTILPYVSGMGAIGKLVVSASGNSENPPDEKTLMDIGWLLEALADNVLCLDMQQQNAAFQIRQGLEAEVERLKQALTDGETA